MRGEKWRQCSKKIHTYFGVSLYHGTAVFVNCGKGQPPKAMGFWRRVVRPTGFEPAAYRVGVIRPSNRKALRRKCLIGVAQISAILKKTSEALLDRASEIFRGSSQIAVCAPDTATPVFIILTTSLSVPLLYSTQRKASPIQPCQKSAFCVRFACAIMPLSTVRRFAPPYQDAPKPVYTPTVQISKSSISCVSTSAYCSAWRFGFPDESSST